MSRTSSFFQQVPSSSLFSGRSKLCKGLYLVPVRVLYPMSCFCKQMQTTTYEIVKGNYVVSNPHDQQGKKALLILQNARDGNYEEVNCNHSAYRFTYYVLCLYSCEVSYVCLFLSAHACIWYSQFCFSRYRKCCWTEK
nr:uncharacterized protein LOC117281085 isoform X1 [Nicotiana tomentosiformis]